MFSPSGNVIVVETPPSKPSSPLQGAGVADLVALSNGGFAIAWRISSSDFEDPFARLKLAAYAANGQRIAGQTIADTDNGADFLTARLAVTAPNDLAFFFQQGSKIEVRGYNFALAQNDPQKSTVPLTLLSPVSSDALGLTNRSLLTFTAADPNGDTQIYGRFFNTANVALANPFKIAAAAGLDQAGARTAQLSNGAVAVVFAEETPSEGDNIRATVISAATGKPTVAGFQVNTVTPQAQSNAEVAALSSGGFVVTWEDAGLSDGSGTAVRARVFDNSGKAVTKDFLVNSNTQGFQEDPEIVALSGGRFAILWDDSNNGSSIRAQMYDRLGNTIGSEAILKQSAPPNFFDELGKVAVLSDGRIILSWVRDIDQEGVLVQAFNVGKAGTAGNDVLTAATAGRYLEGLAGDDRLTGSPFGDVLVGGGGKDVMTGAAGADHFDFASVVEIGKAAGRHDVITDFGLTDVIGLSAIDANLRAGASGNQAFEFIGQAAFTGNALDPTKRGELRFIVDDKPGAENDRTLILGDVNGDRVADFQIELLGKHVLNAGDFVL